MHTVEAYLALDILQLNGISWFLGSTTQLTFSREDEEIASISVKILKRDQIVLRYRYNQSELIVEPIKIEYKPYHFGGERRFFICPGCEQRKAILYCARLFRCRACVGLTYSSQHQNTLERGISRVAELRRKLGGSGSLADPFPPKPKRMRWETYSRRLEKDQRDCERYLSIAVATLDRRLESSK
jgi:hypothetical protein